MPPRQYSRYTYSRAYVDDAGDLILTDPEPFRFKPLSDNRLHIKKAGDTLWALADAYFKPLPRPSGLWWIIADFQPDPLHDPTLRVADGTTLYIPSVRTVVEEVFSEKRRDEG